MRNIKSLNLPYNILTSLKPLSGMDSLESLYVEGNQIKDYSPLLELASLNSLIIGCDTDSQVCYYYGSIIVEDKNVIPKEQYNQLLDRGVNVILNDEQLGKENN